MVRGEDGLTLVDPGIDGADLDQLADDVDRLGIPVVAGFSTHPHWDHLLWHSRFGDVPRYATPPAPGPPVRPASGRRQMAAASASGIPLELIGLLTPLPADGGAVPGEVVEHRAHAVGHAAVLLADRGVLLAGDMLSDVLIPLLDPRQADQVDAYEAALDRLGEAAERRRGPGPRPRGRRRGPRGGGPPRRRSRLPRRAAARRGTGRRAAGPGLARRPAPVEPRSWPGTRRGDPRSAGRRCRRQRPGPQQLVPAATHVLSCPRELVAEAGVGAPAAGVSFITPSASVVAPEHPGRLVRQGVEALAPVPVRAGRRPAACWRRWRRPRRTRRSRRPR